MTPERFVVWSGCVSAGLATIGAMVFDSLFLLYFATCALFIALAFEWLDEEVKKQR